MEEGFPGGLIERLVLEVGDGNWGHGEGVEGTEVCDGFDEGLLGRERVADGEHRDLVVGRDGRGYDAEAPRIAILIPSKLSGTEEQRPLQGPAN